jgi:hypothetical protein
MEIENFELENRQAGVGPFFVGSYGSGDTIEPWIIEKGNQVSLKSDGVTVIAEVLSVTGESYMGKIVSFENFDKEYLHGKAVNDVIEFCHDNIISCSR